MHETSPEGPRITADAWSRRIGFHTAAQRASEDQHTGWTEIFMHPFPRGIPILETAAEVTAEINLARKYLTELPLETL
ncbi:MAG: hypothetical protein R3C53_06080 [Pirellulaceae bacterium]